MADVHRRLNGLASAAVARRLGRIGGDAAGQALHGSTTASPVPVKSLRFRVASASAPAAEAVAAMTASAELIGFAARSLILAMRA
jgi:hypothetical protein